jgi:hypothetical protein
MARCGTSLHHGGQMVCRRVEVLRRAAARELLSHAPRRAVRALTARVTFELGFRSWDETLN